MIAEDEEKYLGTWSAHGGCGQWWCYSTITLSADHTCIYKTVWQNKKAAVGREGRELTSQQQTGGVANDNPENTESKATWTLKGDQLEIVYGSVHLLSCLPLPSPHSPFASLSLPLPWPT